MRVAMSRKMFGRSQHMLRLHAAHERGDESADLRRIFAEAARVDDGIVGIDVHVRDRRVDVIDPRPSVASRATIRPSASASDGSPVAATAIAHGQYVVSRKRMPMPDSRSALISSGTFASLCSRAVNCAVS